MCSKQRVCATYEKRGAESELCFWNLNRNVIDATTPDRTIQAPGHVRAIALATDVYMAACGFTNGDIRLVDLETAEWSAPYTAHRQSVSAIYWHEQVVITGAQDSSFIRWRYSKSKNALSQKGVFVTQANYGSPQHITLELDKFVSVTYNANILGVFEFTKHQIAQYGPYHDVLTLVPKRVFAAKLFDAPEMATVAHWYEISLLRHFKQSNI